MKAKYTIKITHEREEIRRTRRQWKPTGKKDKDGNDEYDYTPQVEELRMVQYTKLEQAVDELDLTAVIKAINGID